MTIPTTAARTAALSAMERIPCSVLELDVDKCANTFGVAPCMASGAAGTECYNTFGTCQAQAAYVKATQTVRFVSRGVTSPAGVPMRPYLLDSLNAPANLDIEAGLATRSSVTVKLADEPDGDTDMDPYFATRATPVQGTFWARFLARNKYYYGRTARVRRGFVASPWDWTLFLDEQYLIDSIAGPDGKGEVQIILKDPLKFADMAKLPAPTSGQLAADIKAIENSGTAASGTWTTITLASSASAVDGAYVGYEVYITTNTGAGQRRTITGYVGATRVATVSSYWLVEPNNTSVYEVGALQLTLDSGSGSQYADPATSGKPEYVRIGSEIIRYTAISGDVLSWPDTTYRAQFGSTAGDHKTKAAVQLCRAFVTQQISAVIQALLTESGIPLALIDTTLLASEDSIWYGNVYEVDACLSAPEQASSLLADLLKQIGAVMWWDAQNQQIKFKAIMPQFGAPPVWTDDANIIKDSCAVVRLDKLRITQAQMNYALEDATANRNEPRNFLACEMAINVDAQGANEYGDTRPYIAYSRWFDGDNQTPMRATVIRKVNRLSDAPNQIKLSIDPKDYTLGVGELVDIQSRRLVGENGAPAMTRCFITKVTDLGAQIDVEARTTGFNKRYGFIAPDGTADYPTDSIYAHISQADGTMLADGSSGYLIS